MLKDVFFIFESHFSRNHLDKRLVFLISWYIFLTVRRVSLSFKDQNPSALLLKRWGLHFNTLAIQRISS